MAKNNFYAVKTGHETGIFTSWPECKVAVEGYSSPDYKGFQTEKEALAYLADEDIYLEQIKDDLANGYVVAYTDGSYDEASNNYAYGVCIFDHECNEIALCNKIGYKDFAASRNIAGEVFAVITALDWAVSNGYDKIKIYYDLENIGKWATGEYDAKSKIAKFYVSKLEKQFKEYIKYEFIKVKAHSNNPYNEKADTLASNALKGKREIIKGANSFSVLNFEKGDLESIIQLIEEENEGIQSERKDILGGKQIKLSIEHESVMIKMYNNKRLLVQGKPNMAYQIVLTYISELLGEKKIIPLVKQAYRIKVDPDIVNFHYGQLCPNIPSGYNDNIKTLIRQAIINLNGWFEAEEYGQYAFPALRALEGHLKYLFAKYNIRITKRFEQFDGNPTRGYVLNGEIGIPAPYSTNIEKCYNFYNKTRHQIFHFGDVFKDTDNTMMITSKDEINTIIRDTLELINNTVY
ncbi:MULTISPECIES: viroplasmin family protein [Aminobacterium]|jgi:ribonuclease HI|uniref:ribonuclease H1 domain-containing protein n=1 Tax=Aminobacterium TaxID=81466 RepID=UPI00257C708E|nr:viroplasmin family protein [Aminobacterium sp. UBA4834]